ncbi:MAG: CRISPR-associated protein [Thiothrix lacustris]|uniref:CRISPR-associated protein n=1 Tax=Thiothrix lacustris TaxID=525917 RepID=A0A1Y1QW82_9GAMM|nr:MAG: CRISPR-associated protein [Thiothrix lacustris]
MTTEKNKPEHFKDRILLMVAGHSPAIITETLYALPKDEKPTEIRIITTASGKEILKKQLLGENNIIQQLCKEHDIPVPRFDESRIHVIAKDGVELQDIQTEDENKITADFITAKVRDLTTKKKEEPECSIHVSIAGGRKTMTYYLGYALSVFGRIQDRMSHVLVEDRYAIPGFFYPTKESTYLTNSRTGETFDAKDVKVMLGELPFIRLRDGLTDDLLNKQGKQDLSYSDIIEIAQRQLNAISVRVVYGNEETKLWCGEEEIKLPPAQLALYVWMLQRRKDTKPAVMFTNAKIKADLAEEFKEVYAKISKESGHYENIIENKFKSMDTDYFGTPRTNINKKLATILGKPKAKAYQLTSKGDKHAKQYNLPDEMQPEHIHIEYAENPLKKPIF